MKSNLDYRELGILGILLQALSESKEVQDVEKVHLKVGDRVVLNSAAFATYFVPQGSDKPIGKDFSRLDENVSSYFEQASGIVVATGLNFKYNCGHCSREHIHDMLINYPALGVTYYCKESEFTLVEKE